MPLRSAARAIPFSTSSNSSQYAAVTWIRVIPATKRPVLLSNAAAGRMGASKIAPAIVAILSLMKAPLHRRAPSRRTPRRQSLRLQDHRVNTFEPQAVEKIYPTLQQTLG